MDSGYENRILLSHDVCWKTHFKHYGGFGFSFILEKFIDYLHGIGVTKVQINKFMVGNPKSVLAFIEHA